MTAALATPMFTLSSLASIPIPSSFDCAMRKAAFAYGQKLLPRKGSFESLCMPQLTKRTRPLAPSLN
jgi:hypothetical protein